MQRSALTAGAAALATSPAATALARRRGAGYGPLVPGELLDLPRGFRYRVVQSIEGRLSNGAPVPGDFDGMAAFRGPRGSTVLVRNHELDPNDVAAGKAPVQGRNPYDPAAPGGTTGIVVDHDRRARASFVTSSGSLKNCAGGGTPWGTWVTCEEDRTPGAHGYCIEVDPTDPENTRSRTPIREMGWFSHEAIDVDPQTGIVYLTEDDFRGDQVPPEEEVPGTTRSSFLYRYVPVERRGRPGSLAEGGRLQVLTIDQRPLFNMDLGKTGDRWRVVWKDVNAEEPHEDALAKGGARFQRLEGAFFAGGSFWFDDTSGGEGRFGQIFRYRPSSNKLELFLEGSSAQQMDAPDNICVTPWGDLWFAEDGTGEQRVMGITPDGDVYEFARNRTIGFDGESSSEFCGPTFAPDGKTFFVNTQHPGHTFAIWGPFRRGGGHAAATRLATAPPRHPYAPQVSGELADAAVREGLGMHEAAAYAALGIDLT
jgi:secreted PhoX family phosphatase